MFLVIKRGVWELENVIYEKVQLKAEYLLEN